MAQNLEFLQLLPPLNKIPSYLTSSIWRIVAFPSHVLWLRPLLGQLQRDVEHVITEYGPGEKWWTLFKQRHPQLALRRSDTWEGSRAEALNPTIVNEYYDLLYDYRDMLVKDKRRKEDLEQQKIKRREERERKKREREKKKEEVAKKKDNVRRGKNRKGGGKDKLQQQPVGRSQMLHSSSDSDSDTGVVAAPRRSVPAIGESSSRSCRPRHQAQLPSLFRSDSDSDNNDGSICTICGCNEPEGLGDEIVFWIDCSICGPTTCVHLEGIAFHVSMYALIVENH